MHYRTMMKSNLFSTFNRLIQTLCKEELYNRLMKNMGAEKKCILSKVLPLILIKGKYFIKLLP